ncbi:MAG TPA: HAMP domain-containing sensor histidine kinase [Candidatus Tumulicola sp.]|jgi:signal transduction histidine kinase
MRIAQTPTASGDLLERLLAITHDILQARDIVSSLESIAESVSILFGFRYVTIVAADEPGSELYRRVLLGARPGINPDRLGERVARDEIKTLLLPEFEVLPHCFFNPVQREVSQSPRQAPDAWHQRDSLTLVLPDRDGMMLGYISVDDPLDGKVPTVDTLRQMQLFLNLVGLALASSRAHRAEVARRELLESSARLQNEFFGEVSHEVRSPLAAIGGAASLLEIHYETMGAERRAELLNVLGSATTRLSKIFEDFLLLSRMDADRLSLHITRVLPVSIIEESVARMRSEHADRTFKVAYFDPTAGVLADEGRLVQVLANLLSNAVKYSTPDTSIDVDVKSSGDREIAISVSNDGAGIPEGDREKLFKRFARLTQDNDSTGLGLYICRELVSKMNGTIGVESDPNGRTTFWFALPRC